MHKRKSKDNSIHIVQLTSVHRREDTRIFQKICCSLAENGYRVTLVVADGKGDDRKNGVDIVDCGKPRGKIDRILKTTKSVYAKGLELNGDIYHFHDPELIPIGLKLKKKNKKVVFDIHEKTAIQIHAKPWIPYWCKHISSYLYDWYEKSSCKKFDALIVPQDSMFQEYKKINKTLFLANFPKITKLKKQAENTGKFNLLYLGTINKERGFYNLLYAFEEIHSRDAKYKLTLIGELSNVSMEAIENSPAKNGIHPLGFIEKDKLDSILQDHSIGLIMFNNIGQYYMSYSVKLFEYMENGLSVVMPDFGEWPKFNREHNVGWNVSTTNPQQFADAIENVSLDELEKIGTRNRQTILKKFRWETEEKKLFELYSELLAC